MSLYEDVALSIEPGQRCHMRERLSIAISGLRPHRETGPPFSVVEGGTFPLADGDPMV